MSTPSRPHTPPRSRGRTVFNDGNERAAFQVMDLVLDLNGVRVAWDTEAVGGKIIELAQSRLDETAFADWLRRQPNEN